jgi:two-component system response regulator DesR
VSSDLLVRSIRTVATGKLVIDPDLACTRAHMTGNPLTSRELDALRLASEGVPTAEIASLLDLAPGTVRNYLSRVIGKVGARNRLDAIRIATEAGWLVLSISSRTSSTLDADTEPGSHPTIA